MGFTNEEINYVYDKTDGYCYYCGKRLSFTNYGRYGSHGAWQIDHSRARATGGSNYLRNLVPACTKCNQDKGTSRGTYYKNKFEPATLGGKLNEFFGFGPGSLGASRRRIPK